MSFRVSGLTYHSTTRISVQALWFKLHAHTRYSYLSLTQWLMMKKKYCEIVPQKHGSFWPCKRLFWRKKLYIHVTCCLKSIFLFICFINSIFICIIKALIDRFTPVSLSFVDCSWVEVMCFYTWIIFILTQLLKYCIRNGNIRIYKSQI